MQIETMNNGEIKVSSAQLQAEYKKSKKLGILTEKSEYTYKRMIARARQVERKSTEVSQTIKQATEWANRREDEAREDTSGKTQTLRVIEYIRNADNGEQNLLNPLYAAVTGWTGYILDDMSRENVLSILREWENELNQENYTKNSVNGDYEAYSECYFRNNGHSVEVESLSGNTDSVADYGKI